MDSDDILFLVVFIIIPTAIVVSGFWLLLFLRRGRPAPVISTAETEHETETTSDEQPTVIIDDLEDGAEEELIGPMTADLLAESEEPLVDEPEQETIETEILDPTGRTEEIPCIAEESFEPARVADPDEAEWQPTPAVEDDEPEAPAPAEDEEDSTTVDRTDTPPDEEADAESGDEPTDDEQRTPGSKLLPGRHSQPRKRRGSRRAPKLRRLRRDEDSVEGADGSGSVDPGDGE